MVKASDLQLRGCGFNSWPFYFYHQAYASCLYTCTVSLSPGSVNWYRSRASVLLWLRR